MFFYYQCYGRWMVECGGENLVSIKQYRGKICYKNNNFLKK